MKPHPNDITIRGYRHRRFLAADELAKAWRAYIAQRVCDQTQEQLNFIMNLSIRWMRLAGKECYQKPKGWPESPSAVAYHAAWEKHKQQNTNAEGFIDITAPPT